MARFYFLLWIRWSFRVILCSTILAFILSSLIILFLYMSHAVHTLNSNVFMALLDIFIFWFPIAWSFSLLIALFRSVKYIFNNCINGYEFKLLTCSAKEYIEYIGYGDLVKVWRKWFMLLIWLSVSMIVVTFVFMKLFTDYKSLFEWFNIYSLVSFVLLSGYISFTLFAFRCKRVKLKKC